MDQLPKLLRVKCKLLLVPIEHAMKASGSAELMSHALTTVICFMFRPIYNWRKISRKYLDRSLGAPRVFLNTVDDYSDKLKVPTALYVAGKGGLDNIWKGNNMLLWTELHQRQIHYT
jgi:hypothetical protein